MIAGAGFGQQRVAMAVRAGDLGADVRADACFLGRHVEAGRAVDSVAVEERHGGHAEIGAGRDQLFG